MPFSDSYGDSIERLRFSDEKIQEPPKVIKGYPQRLHIGTFRKLLFIRYSRRLRNLLMGLLGYGEEQLLQKYSYPHG